MEILKKNINQCLLQIYSESEIYKDIFTGGKKLRPIISYLIFNQFNKNTILPMIKMKY